MTKLRHRRAPCCACGLVTTIASSRAFMSCACQNRQLPRSACLVSPGRLGQNSSSGLSSVHRVAGHAQLSHDAHQTPATCFSRRQPPRRRRASRLDAVAATRDWPDKCYKEIGPIAYRRLPFTAGRNHSGCKQLCAEQSATARLLCLHSADELHFVVNTSHIDGWVGYEQDKQAADYSEPGGGWGWTTCSSTWTASWANVSAPYIASPHGAAHASPIPSPVI